MFYRPLLAATIFTAMSLAFAAIPDSVPGIKSSTGGRTAQRQAGTTVVYLTHGQWVSWDYGTRELAIQALNQYRSLGIPAFIR